MKSGSSIFPFKLVYENVSISEGLSLTFFFTLEFPLSKKKFTLTSRASEILFIEVNVNVRSPLSTCERKLMDKPLRSLNSCKVIFLLFLTFFNSLPNASSFISHLLQRLILTCIHKYTFDFYIVGDAILAAHFSADT